MAPDPVLAFNIKLDNGGGRLSEKGAGVPVVHHLVPWKCFARRRPQGTTRGSAIGFRQDRLL